MCRTGFILQPVQAPVHAHGDNNKAPARALRRLTAWRRRRRLVYSSSRSARRRRVWWNSRTSGSRRDVSYTACTRTTAPGNASSTVRLTSCKRTPRRTLGRPAQAALTKHLTQLGTGMLQRMGGLSEHFSWQVGLHMSGCNDRCLCLMQTGEPLSSHIKGGPRVGAHLLDAHTSLQGVLSFRPGIDGHIGQTALVVVVAPLTCIEAACTLSQRRPQPSHHTCMRADDCLEPPRCAPNRQAVLQHRYAPHRLP